MGGKTRSPASGFTPVNSEKICAIGFLTTWASTLSLPRCGMPMTIDSTPNSAARSIIAFMPGISVSHPSSPNRLAAAYLAARNDSNISDQARRSRMWRLRAGEKFGGSAVSTRSRIQLQRARSGMCMNS